MSYELKKPFTDTEKLRFISNYNYKQDLAIEDGTDTYEQGDLTLMGEFLFALEKNEIMGTVEAEIDVPDYVTKVDEEGHEYQVPIMIEVEETIIVPIYDPETGEQTGEEEQTITKSVPQTHKETVELYKPVINPDYEEEQLIIAKQNKYNEANSGARQFLESGNALFEFDEGKHIEATDGNIAKLTAYALAYVTGQLQPSETVVWNTKEDETVELTAEQIAQIVKGLGFVQASVWSVQFPQYIQAIETAETTEEVNAITIEYYSEIPVTEEE